MCLQFSQALALRSRSLFIIFALAFLSVVPYARGAEEQNNLVSSDDAKSISEEAPPVVPHQEEDLSVMPLPMVADPARYWGNSFSLKFHQPSCPFAQAMNPRHVQFFQNLDQATSSGEKPCRYCLPPYWTAVHCILLTPQPARAADRDEALARTGHRGNSAIDTAPHHSRVNKVPSL
jgi:hypothetical protein